MSNEQNKFVTFPLRISKEVLGEADIESISRDEPIPVCQFIEEATKEKIEKIKQERKEREIKNV